MTGPFDILIAGAGTVGLTLAALLCEADTPRRLRIRVLDGGPRPHYVGGDLPELRVSAISPGSATILERAGVWQEVRNRRVYAYHAMRVWDAAGYADSAETLRFDAADLGVPELGFIVEDALIRVRLLERLAELDVSVRFDTPIRRLIPQHARFIVDCDDSAHLLCELIVGADGAMSTVRTQAAIGVRNWRYPQSALVTHARTERPHCDTAWQRFLPDGPIALLPLGEQRVSIVWSTTPERAAAARDAAPEMLDRMLSEASDQVLGALTATGPRAVFPLQAQYAERYCREGLVLVGDAAHNVHPLAGQGVNLGIADAAVLADALAQTAEHGEHPGDLSALRRYERARKGENLLMLHFVDAIGRLFASDSAALARLRGNGIRLFNLSGPVRRGVARVALGLGR